jgi:hypothetical protein
VTRGAHRRNLQRLQWQRWTRFGTDPRPDSDFRCSSGQTQWQSQNQPRKRQQGAREPLMPARSGPYFSPEKEPPNPHRSRRRQPVQWRHFQSRSPLGSDLAQTNQRDRHFPGLLLGSDSVQKNCRPRPAKDHHFQSLLLTGRGRAPRLLLPRERWTQERKTQCCCRCRWNFLEKEKPQTGSESHLVWAGLAAFAAPGHPEIRLDFEVRRKSRQRKIAAAQRLEALEIRHFRRRLAAEPAALRSYRRSTFFLLSLTSCPLPDSPVTEKNKRRAPEQKKKEREARRACPPIFFLGCE